MRVILTQHLTYHAGTLLVRLITRIANTQHTIQDTAVYGFKTITHIWQCTCYDNRH